MTRGVGVAPHPASSTCSPSSVPNRDGAPIGMGAGCTQAPTPRWVSRGFAAASGAERDVRDRAQGEESDIGDARTQVGADEGDTSATVRLGADDVFMGRARRVSTLVRESPQPLYLRSGGGVRQGTQIHTETDSERKGGKKGGRRREHKGEKERGKVAINLPKDVEKRVSRLERSVRTVLAPPVLAGAVADVRTSPSSSFSSRGKGKTGTTGEMEEETRRGTGGRGGGGAALPPGTETEIGVRGGGGADLAPGTETEIGGRGAGGAALSHLTDTERETETEIEKPGTSTPRPQTPPKGRAGAVGAGRKRAGHEGANVTRMERLLKSGRMEEALQLMDELRARGEVGIAHYGMLLGVADTQHIALLREVCVCSVSLSLSLWVCVCVCVVWLAGVGV